MEITNRRSKQTSYPVSKFEKEIFNKSEKEKVSDGKSAFTDTGTGFLPDIRRSIRGPQQAFSVRKPTHGHRND
jgi:hypothetical protein